jgi:2-oxoglutarate dehydrogenase E2 component (dihydrolipoamide succinyltransferase)
MVALECGRIELEPSIRRSLTSSGELSTASARTATADGNAKTIEAVALRGVEARQKRAAQQGPSMTLDAHTLPDSPAPVDPPSAAPAQAPAIPDDTASERTVPRKPGPGASRGPLIVSVVALTAALGIVAWRGLVARSDALSAEQAAPGTSALAAHAPLPAPAAVSSSAAPVVPSAASNVVPSPLAAPLPSASAAKAAAPSRARGAAPSRARGAASAPAPPPASPPKAPSRLSPPPAAPAASPAPAAPAATVADPSSYR